MSALTPHSPPPAATLPALLRQRWAGLAERERVVVAVAGAGLLALVVWLVAIRPAMHALAIAPTQRALVDGQTLQMQAITAEAAQLKAIPPVPQLQAEQVLKSATEQLGPRGRIVMQSGRATLTLANATGEDLRNWLVQARGGARARPTELQLTRSDAGYSGTLVVTYGPA